MEKESNRSDWLHVIVCSKDDLEYYMGMHDHTGGVDFIPVFEHREEAESCLQSLGKKSGIHYQVMAVLGTELIKSCTDKNYIIALVDKNGTLIRQFTGEDNVT